jgi:two-component system, cell cycle response regulator DivK
MRSHPDDAHMNRVRRDHDDGNARDLRRAPEMSSRPRSSSSRRSPRRRPVILIADDTTDTRDLYAEHFRTRGFTVVTAHDGPAVVNAALEHVPDVIVMDLAMPQYDGLTATRKIKEDARTRRTRVILLTGFPMNTIARQASEAGVDRYLTKPCLPEELQRHVNELRRPTDDIGTK